MATQPESLKISLDSLSLTLCDSMPTLVCNKQNASGLQNGAPESLKQSFVFVPENGDDGESIVVLDTNSLETIHMQSLTAFEEINRRSLEMDCQAFILSLAPDKLKEKLAEVLQDNLRMKEVLVQNGLTMKERLITLMNKQEELTKVHHAHRQMFTDTKNLVGMLRLENDELKARLEAEKTRKTDTKDESCQTENTGETAEAAVSTTSIDNEFAGEVLRITEKSEGQAREIAHLQKVIESLNRQVQQVYPSLTAGLKLEAVKPVETESSEDSRRKDFSASLARYNENLLTLTDSYEAQDLRYVKLQECLHRCTEILSERPQSTGPASHRSLDSQIYEKLLEYRNKLTDEELKIVIERQQMLHIHSEFRNIFVDYNSALNELKILREENERMASQQKDCLKLHDERLEEARARLRESERLLEQQRFSFQQEQFKLSEQKCNLEREQLRFRDEEQKFVVASVVLNEELAAMRETNDLLRHQCELYETDYNCERSLRERTIAENHQLLEEMVRREN